MLWRSRDAIPKKCIWFYPGADIMGKDKLLHPTDTAGYNYLFLLSIHASGTQVPPYIRHNQSLINKINIAHENFTSMKENPTNKFAGHMPILSPASRFK